MDIDKKALLSLILLSFIWGYNWVLMKQSIHYMPELYFAFFRSILGSFLLFGILAFNNKSLKLKHIKYVSILGLLQTTGFVGLTILALKFAKAGKTAILVYSMPFWLVLFSWKILKEIPDKREIVSNVVAFTGLFLVLEPWNTITGKGFLGDALAILSGISWAFAVIWQKKYRSLTLDIVSLNAWQMLIGSVGILFFAVMFEKFYIKLSYLLLFGIAYNAILANALAWVIWSYAIKRLPSGFMGLTMLITPVIGMIASMIILKEKMDVYEILGSFFIVLGLLINTLDHIRKSQR
ncbi:DMT family transporter [Hydrogenobaculum acidophilum]